MTRLTASLIATSLLFSAAASQAQDTGGTDPKINTVILFGDDQCPESTDDQINVCAILSRPIAIASRLRCALTPTTSATKVGPTASSAINTLAAKAR